MSNDALEPASSIIARFGGPDKVQEVTGASRTRVYRWTQSKERGGTDGIIPMLPARKLLQHARENGIAVTGEDLIGAPSGQ
jgi:hypothetical protein